MLTVIEAIKQTDLIEAFKNKVYDYDINPNLTIVLDQFDRLYSVDRSYKTKYSKRFLD